MRRFTRFLRPSLIAFVGLPIALSSIAGCGQLSSLAKLPEVPSFEAALEHAAKETLESFGSEAELEGYLEKLREQQNGYMGAEEDGYSYGGALDDAGAAPAPQPSPPPPPAQAPSSTASKAAAEAPSDSAAGEAEESVTNVQHAGVDEGGIVKVHGNHLIVLRRGRLFTVDVGGDQLRPVSSIDAFGPGIDPNGTWYDEMLVNGNTIVVIGYSYDRGGTEIGLFEISNDGELSYRDTYHLRSNDYYSSRNYASRLIGDKLIFYTPLWLDLWADDALSSFPALRKWHKDAKASDFKRIASATNTYPPLFDSPDLSLHTVTVCDLGGGDMDCTATAVFGPSGRVFYVSPGSVYVWTTDYSNYDDPQSLLYRMPLNGSAPSVLRVAGGPVDQFSFLEDQEGFLNVVVRSDAPGETMWGAESAAGEVALLRVPLESFAGGKESAPRSAYRLLPQPQGNTFQNRFVGTHLLYGTGSGWGMPESENEGTLFAVRFADDQPAEQVGLVHGVDRIEALGTDAVAVGTDGKDLHFTSVALSGKAKVASRYSRPGASQGELRSHGFFYKPEDATGGLLGLPIREPAAPGFAHLFQESASILFLRNQSLALSELGILESKPDAAADDNCKASCVDWYGNARPLFLKGRVFALLGYELVEGKLAGGRIGERRRVSFAPVTKIAQ